MKTLKTQPTQYEKLLKQSQAEKDTQEIQFQVEEVHQQLQSDILATKRELAKANRELFKAKSSYPFNAQKVIDAQMNIESFENGLQRLEALVEELF